MRTRSALRGIAASAAILPFISVAGQRPMAQRDTVSVPTLMVLLFANDGPTATAAANSLIAHAKTDTTVLPTLVRNLVADDMDQRVAHTILEIDSTGAKAVPMLLRITDEQRNAAGYFNAMSLLGDYGPRAWTAASPILDRMLRSPERWNGLEVQTLARIGVDSISSGVRAVSIDTFRVRALRGVDGSLVMLGLLGAPATAVLMEIGAKGNSETAEAVIEMLGPLAESGDSLVLRYLIGQLDASSGSVRDQAASVLQATGASGLARLDSVRVHGSRRASKAASSAIAGINLGLRSGVVGSCYRLEAGEWTSEGKVGWKGWENPHVVRFTLLPGRIARDGPQWRVVAERGSRESAFGPGSWTFDAKHPTRVTLSWYDGLAGPFLTYEFVGDSVSGSGYFASDVRPPEPYRAKAWAIRVPCTAR